MEKIYILGAHSRAQTLGVYLTYLYPQVSIEAYFYTNEEENPKFIDNILVMDIKEANSLCKKYPLFIGTRGVYHESLIKMVKEMGFQKIYPVTVEMDLKLRDAYLRKYYKNIGREYIKFDELPFIEEKTADSESLLCDTKQANNESAVIYTAKSIFDKSLQVSYQAPEYERDIQVGAALTSKRLEIDVCTDDTGDNISIKNKQYCELTAMYWIWKNAKEDIVGLVHYRRHFILPKYWVSQMKKNEVDIVLPLPLYVGPSLEENFKKRHDKQVWQCAMECLKELYPNDYEDAKLFFKGNLYSPCNMFIMKKEILDKFCSWLFPILEAVEVQIGTLDDVYQNRYPGFLSERLMTFYFEKYRNEYKVVYTDKNFLL